MYLQNIYSAKTPLQQNASLGLCLSEMVLQNKGAWRMHGGGFGGTSQSFVPHDLLSNYIETMESVFGKDSCMILKIRNDGVIRVL